jgi:hypothetical protein
MDPSMRTTVSMSRSLNRTEQSCRERHSCIPYSVNFRGLRPKHKKKLACVGPVRLSKGKVQTGSRFTVRATRDKGVSIGT